MNRGIPVIDIGPFSSGPVPERAQVVRDVADACEHIGFLIISGHDIDQALLDEAFAISRDFFDLPVEQKLQASPVGEVAPRGYAAMASKGLAGTLGVDAPKDLREQFMMGTPNRCGPPLPNTRTPRADSPNVWPEIPKAYRTIFSALYREMEILAARLMAIFALGLGLPESYFKDKIDHHFSVLGSNHYPQLTQAPELGQLRTGAHTDFGSLTILCQHQGPVVCKSTWPTMYGTTCSLCQEH